MEIVIIEPILPKMGKSTFSFWSFERGVVRGFMCWTSPVFLMDCSTSFVRSLFFGIKSRARRIFKAQLQKRRMSEAKRGGEYDCDCWVDDFEDMLASDFRNSCSNKASRSSSPTDSFGSEPASA